MSNSRPGLRMVFGISSMNVIRDFLKMFGATSAPWQFDYWPGRGTEPDVIRPPVDTGDRELCKVWELSPQQKPNKLDIGLTIVHPRSHEGIVTPGYPRVRAINRQHRFNPDEPVIPITTRVLVPVVI